MLINLSLSVAASRVTGMPVHILTTSSMFSSSTTGWSSPLSSSHSLWRVSSFSLRPISRSRSSAANSYCLPEIASSFSLRTSSNILETSFTDNGAELKFILTREAASSMRSIALSGRNLSAINREAKLAADRNASSEISKLWCSSYFSLTPLKISTVSSTEGSSTLTG